MPITTNVVSSNPAFWRRNVLDAKYYVIMFVSDLQQVGWFSGYSGVLHQYNWPPRYNRNIVESGVKYHTYWPSFDYEHIWWRLLQKRVVYIKLDIYGFISSYILNVIWYISNNWLFYFKSSVISLYLYLYFSINHWNT